MPEFKFNLLSIGKLLSDQPIFTTIYPHKCVFQDLITEKVVVVAPFDGRLYRLSSLSPGPPVMQSSKSTLTASNNAQCDSVSFNTLHARLGHTSMSKMQHIALCKSHQPIDFFCETCIFAKSQRLHFHTNTVSSTSPFQLIHMDLWGPYRVVSITGAKYFLTIIDDFSRCTWTTLLQNKSQVASVIAHFFSMAETQF